MDKCRICFKQDNSLYCIHELDDSKRISFLEMIIAITTVKNVSSDAHNKMCLSCKEKTIEAYDFKMLIERADMILQDINPKTRITFCNINEIKNRLDYKEEKDSKQLLPPDLIREINKGICTTYNNIVIRKINNESNKENKEMPVLDILESIEMGIKNEDFDYNTDGGGCSPISDDDEYIPRKPVKRKEYKRKRKAAKAVNGVGNVCIKPVYLKDVGVLYYDPKERKKKIELYRAKYYRNKREDICCYCGKLTKSLKYHMLVHEGERKYKCEICSKAYLAESHLKNHHNLSHLNIRKFKCDMCVATFPCASALKSHMKSHSNIKSFFCDVCSKGFKRKFTLMRHIKQHNSVNRNIKCEFCSMTFYNKPALRHHMRVHTGERPYKCEICSQPYSYKRDFNRHCLKKHGVFLNRRSVNVMNEEVLKGERLLMNDLLLRKQGLIKDDQPLNPFQGPQAAMAFEQVMQALDNRQIHEDL